MSRSIPLSPSAASAQVALTRRLPALAALALGLVLVLGAGFAGPSALHNATHDGRHAFALPCH
jgi:cobalt transporter subunit CbtB